MVRLEFIAQGNSSVKTFTYTIHLEPVAEGGFVVSVPALPGCLTQGETYEECLAMAQECIEGYLEALIKAGRPIPIETPSAEAITAIIQVKSALAV